MSVRRLGLRAHARIEQVYELAEQKNWTFVQRILPAYNDTHRVTWKRDNGYHVQWLEDSIALGCAEVIVEYGEGDEPSELIDEIKANLPIWEREDFSKAALTSTNIVEQLRAVRMWVYLTEGNFDDELKNIIMTLSKHENAVIRNCMKAYVLMAQLPDLQGALKSYSTS